MHVLKFEQSSVARQVRVITYEFAQLPAVVTSVYVIKGATVQLSVAVAVPVPAGSTDASQLIVISAGHVITGAVIS
jgi:hypothetical protein